MGEEFYFLYLLKPFTRRRAGYFGLVLRRRKLNVALLRPRLRSLPQNKIPHRFGRVTDFHSHLYTLKDRAKRPEPFGALCVW